MGMSFSVVIPTRNAGLSFDSLLYNLTLQAGCLKEIIIIDSSSTDNTVEIARKYNARIVIIPCSEFDHGGTRNLGANLATGDIILFATQDIVLADKMLFAAFESFFIDPMVGGAFARQLPRLEATTIEILSRIHSYQTENRINILADLQTNGVKALYFANPCACVRRSVFKAVGGFPDRTICNEDMVIAWKILKSGLKTAYVADARVYHSHNYNLIQLVQRYFDIGVFFKDQPDLNKSASNASEGLDQLKKNIGHLIRGNNYQIILLLIFNNIARLIGYSLGKRYQLIPNRLRERFSMNANYWKNFRSS